MRHQIGFILLFILSINTRISAQSFNKSDTALVQFSGLILTADSIMPVPYVNIFIPGTGRGTISDLNGFFSFVARKGDIVKFSAVGYKTSSYAIPDSLSGYKYSMIKLLTADTFFLDEAVIQILPSRQMFNHYFVKADVPDDDLERARKNLEREAMREQIERMGMDGQENSKYYLQQQAQKFYWAGQIPPMNLFSPIAWARFFEAWKRGDFKNQSKQ